MRISAIMILFALLAGTSGTQAQKVYMPEVPADYGYIVNIGQHVPDIEMVITDGKKVKMSDLKGKVVMLQFTASWCSVCRKEMPHIEKEIWKKYRKNSGFALYGIDMDEPLEKVVKFEKDIGITYPMALDPGGKLFYTFAAKGAGVTRNVIIDKSGKIVFLTRLYKEDEFKKMTEVIADLLK